MRPDSAETRATRCATRATCVRCSDTRPGSRRCWSRGVRRPFIVATRRPSCRPCGWYASRMPPRSHRRWVQPPRLPHARAFRERPRAAWDQAAARGANLAQPMAADSKRATAEARKLRRRLRAPRSSNRTKRTRDHERKRAPLPGVAHELHAPSVRFHDVLHDGKPQA